VQKATKNEEIVCSSLNLSAVLLTSNNQGLWQEFYLGVQRKSPTAASPSKYFLSKFGWIWAKLMRNLGKSD